jgi:TatA/E family protein of Tat protein translocase
MFDIGLQELLVIGVLALLVFGPSKLPELGRMFGRAMREFRRASDEFRTTVETNLKINEPDPVIAPASYIETPAVGASDTATVSTTLPSEAESTPAESTSAAPVAAVSTEPFCAQRGSRLFHRATCDWARRIPAGERIDLPSMTGAREQGFVGCPVCEPWEPS